MNTPEAHEDLISRGRGQVQAAVAAMLMLSLSSILLYLFRIGTDRLPQQALRFALALGLAYALIRGQPWARWVTVLLCLGALYTVGVGVQHPQATWGSRLFMVGFGLVYVWVARLMLWSPNVAAFFKAPGVAPAANSTVR